MDMHELRGQVGLVSQEPVLFSCSMRDNIVYGKPEASQQQVEQAAQAANAHNFIQKLPEGYDTQVSESMPITDTASVAHSAVQAWSCPLAVSCTCLSAWLVVMLAAVTARSCHCK